MQQGAARLALERGLDVELDAVRLELLPAPEARARGLPQLLVSLPQGLRKVALVRLLRHLGALRNNLAFREEGLRRLDFVGQDLGRLVERARIQVDLDG